MRKLYVGLLALVVMACNDSSKNQEQEFIASLSEMKTEGPGISEEVISDIIQQIPSPLEISTLLKEEGSKYDKSFLNNPKNTSQYNSNYKKALNLGIYGTDLGYANIYEQNQEALGYLTAVRDLANGLSIGQFFDFGTIKRLATNSRNLDSLLMITTKNFNNINNYLQQQQRSNLSILLLTGGWLEATHIICKVQEKKGNEALKEKIGEQKIILENIMLLLSFYENSDPNISKLMEDMKPLQSIFSEIEITYSYKESTFEEVDGMLVIKDNSTSSINITNQHVADITKETAAIRNKIIN